MILVTLLLSSFVHAVHPRRRRERRRRALSVSRSCVTPGRTLLVPVSVQGGLARPFVLDTGSSITVIDDRTAADLGLTPAGRIASPSPSGSDPVVIAQLTVGSVALPPGRVVVADVRQLARLLGDVGGILGSDALRAMGRTTIDYAQCRLTVGGAAAEADPSHWRPFNQRRRRLEPRRRAVRIPFEWHQGRPVITVGGGARLLLDSGTTTVTVFTDTAAAATLRWNSRAAAIVRIDRLDGARIGRLGELACLTIGDLALKDIPAVAVRSWYDRRDARAPDGLLPLGLFSLVHIAHAEGYVELVPRVPLTPVPRVPILFPTHKP